MIIGSVLVNDMSLANEHVGSQSDPPLFCQIEFKTPRWQQQKHSTGFFQTSREACQCFLLSMDRTEFRSISCCLTQIFCFLSVSVLPLFLYIIKAAKDIGASKSSEKNKQLEQTAEIWQLPLANDFDLLMGAAQYSDLVNIEV